MKKVLLLKFGCGLLLMASGCVTNDTQTLSLGAAPREVGSTSEMLFQNYLLEIVTVKGPGDIRISVVLNRQDVVDALGWDKTSVEANDWADVEVDKEKLMRVWLPGTLNTGENRKSAERRLAECAVLKTYSLAELGVHDSQALLEKFFEKQTPSQSVWWRKKLSPEAKIPREPDLVAVLKKYGLEVAQGDVVPVLLARPKPTGGR